MRLLVYRQVQAAQAANRILLILRDDGFEPRRHTRFRVLQPVAETLCQCDVWTGVCKCAHQDVTTTPRGGDRLREQTGAKSVARALHGAQAAEVDCVGVHAFTTENVRARDPGVTE